MTYKKKTGADWDGINASTILLAFTAGVIGGTMVAVFCTIYWLGAIWRSL